MKAVVQDQYGPPEEVLRVQEVGTPAIGDDEVLVRVRTYPLEEVAEAMRRLQEGRTCGAILVTP